MLVAGGTGGGGLRRPTARRSLYCRTRVRYIASAQGRHVPRSKGRLSSARGSFSLYGPHSSVTTEFVDVPGQLNRCPSHGNVRPRSIWRVKRSLGGIVRK